MFRGVGFVVNPVTVMLALWYLDFFTFDLWALITWLDDHGLNQGQSKGLFI